jgi:hypothetical protein
MNTVFLDSGASNSLGLQWVSSDKEKRERCVSSNPPLPCLVLRFLLETDIPQNIKDGNCDYRRNVELQELNPSLYSLLS